jgi:hypothetical protein
MNIQQLVRHATFVSLALLSTSVLAAAAGTVTHLSGTLSVQRPDGSVRILSQKSEVNQGDVLTTQRESYAQINFADGSSLTMRPETQLKIETFNFVQDRPQEDSSFMRLVKGGLRTVTGLVGKRGNQDAYKIGTNTATIGIRGSSGQTEVNPPNLPEGTYHATFTGSYYLQNEAGITTIGEGQFGFVRDPRSPPTILPGDPGLKLTELPFTLGVGGGPGGTCQVR